jgi:hypothetical protein
MPLLEAILILGLVLAGGLVIALRWKVGALWFATFVTLIVGVIVGILSQASLLAIGGLCVALVAILQIGYLLGLWIGSAERDP